MNLTFKFSSSSVQIFEKCVFSCPQVPTRMLTGQCAVAWPHSFTSSWFERVDWIQAEVFSPKGLFYYFYDASQLYLWCCSPSQNLTAPICGSLESPYSIDEVHWVKSPFTRQPALYHFSIFFSWIKNAFLAYCTQTNAVLGGSLSGSWSNELWLSEWWSQPLDSWLSTFYWFIVWPQTTSSYLPVSLILSVITFAWG